MSSAAAVVTLGVFYVVVGLIGVVTRRQSASPLTQVDPYLAILEVTIIVSAVVLVVMMASVHAYAPPERGIFSHAALAFVICSALMTCAVHFVSLTVGRQISPGVSPLLSHQLSFVEGWPTIALSLDLLAWDFFLGLALIFAAQVFEGEAALRVRISMIVAGTLCLVGTLGPASGHMQIQYLGIAGYAFALPIACGLLAIFFRQTRASESG